MASQIRSNIPEHDRLFNEICGKLSELSQKSDVKQPGQDQWSERLEQMHNSLKMSQEELKATQTLLEEKIRTFDSMSVTSNDSHNEFKKLTEQLEQERMNNSKLSTDLAKSLELNLKLQFEIEEIRARANNVVQEERKLNLFLTEKNKAISTELELSQALQNETRLELSKAKDRFASEYERLQKTIESLEARNKDLGQQLDASALYADEFDVQLQKQNEEIARLNSTLQEYQEHASQQNEILKNLSSVAEKKMIELKLALDKKTIEGQDYYSHLQQALTQIQVLRQENAALKDYISKLTALHQARAPEARV
jgi:chromosome segregation ATPase